METVENFSIIKISKTEQQIFVDIVNQIINAKNNGDDIGHFEIKIDRLVYELYDLTDEEIKIIENS